MGKDSKIEWTHHTFNPWWGCQRVSPGCENCYAEAFAHRLGKDIWGPTTGRRIFGDKHWNEPIKWNREAAARGERRRVFCASMADVFEDRRDLDEHRARLWKLIEATPNLDWLLLTKRPEKIVIPVAWRRGVVSNVWIGTTVEDSVQAARRLPELMVQRWAAVRFVSYEPALGAVDFSVYLPAAADWIIVGGESGPNARPFELAWASDTIKACRTAGVAVFVKQLGRMPYYRNPDRVLLRLKDGHGGDWDEWPAPDKLRVREFPTVRS